MLVLFCDTVLRKTFLSLAIIVCGGMGVGAQSALELTPNACFFGPKGTLQAVADKSRVGDKYNNGTFLSHITSWEQLNDTILWRVRIAQPGVLDVTPYISVSATGQNAVIAVNIGGCEREIALHSGKEGFAPQEGQRFDIAQRGEYTINLILKKKMGGGSVGDVQKVVLEGTAAQGAEVMRVRWRPAAIHAQMRHVSHPRNVIITVVEDVPVTKDVWMYHPVTTPFGYAGTSWNEVEQEFGGINFSLWSYGAKAERPPVAQLSHLIAVGKGLVFGGFSHEGTGVKPRGASPYAGKKTDAAVVAVRMEPGEKYNTYYSYYLDPETGDKWRLWGAGKQYNHKGKTSYLTTGKFVEVVGPPTVGRTGHRQRVLKTRGWCVTQDGRKLPLNEMAYGGNSEPEMTAKVWAESDGYFVLKTGGFGGQVVDKGVVVVAEEKIPVFLSDGMMEQLYQLPCDMCAEKNPVKLEKGKAVVRVVVAKAGTGAKATLYWGESDGVTFDDKESGYLWKNKKTVVVKQGGNDFVIKELPDKGRCYWRLKVENDEGVTWLKETESFEITE